MSSQDFIRQSGGLGTKSRYSKSIWRTIHIDPPLLVGITAALRLWLARAVQCKWGRCSRGAKAGAYYGRRSGGYVYRRAIQCALL